MYRRYISAAGVDEVQRLIFCVGGSSKSPGSDNITLEADMPPSSLLCPICYESFDDKDRIPVLLDQCGHSFCRSCLKAGGSSINRCPQCRQSITKSISNLKTNHALVEALDVEKIASEWKGEPWFEEQDVSYATILASMQSDVLDSVLKKLKVAGFDVNK